jgi:1-piperideine-2-carboxylate/1-pyrroline-2-carboxylate reductase [NAD(P)H]
VSAAQDAHDLPLLSGDAIAQLVDLPGAVQVLADALASGGLDPEQDGPRLFAPVDAGREFLMMPATGGGRAGVKVVSLAPGNPAAAYPAVQGVYVLFESAPLTPIAVLDAAEMTLLRTPAITVLAASRMLAAKRGGADAVLQPDAADALKTVIFGTGPQAGRHIACVQAVIGSTEIAVVGRREEAINALVAASGGAEANVRPAGDLSEELARAELIICVTSSTTPLFANEDIGPDTVVCAVGSHGPDRHELPPGLVRRSDLVVEARAAAMREGGNLLQARPAEEWMAGLGQRPLANLAELVCGRFVAHADRPAVFSGSGMAWQDLVIASHVHELHLRRTGEPSATELRD